MMELLLGTLLGVLACVVLIRISLRAGWLHSRENCRAAQAIDDGPRIVTEPPPGAVDLGVARLSPELVCAAVDVAEALDEREAVDEIAIPYVDRQDQRQFAGDPAVVEAYLADLAKSIRAAGLVNARRSRARAWIAEALIRYRDVRKAGGR